MILDGIQPLIPGMGPLETLVTGATARYGLSHGTQEEIAESIPSKEQVAFPIRVKQLLPSA